MNKVGAYMHLLLFTSDLLYSVARIQASQLSLDIPVFLQVCFKLIRYRSLELYLVMRHVCI